MLADLLDFALGIFGLGLLVCFGCVVVGFSGGFVDLLFGVCWCLVGFVCFVFSLYPPFCRESHDVSVLCLSRFVVMVCLCLFRV